MKTLQDGEWINAIEKKPEYNVSVLVFIPGEDDHCTSGMWDISNKWVLLDEYRVPEQEVTYWRPMVPPPEDKSYTRIDPRPQEEETMTYKIRQLQIHVFNLQQQLSALQQENENLVRDLRAILQRSEKYSGAWIIATDALQKYPV